MIALVKHIKDMQEVYYLANKSDNLYFTLHLTLSNKMIKKLGIEDLNNKKATQNIMSCFFFINKLTSTFKH